MAEPGSIRDYHAHIYFDLSTREVALLVREEIGERFTVRLGRVHDIKVGPHPKPMYQVAFAPEVFADFVPWLLLNRRGLIVLLHPETGRERDDHTQHAAWMGAVLPLDISMLRDDATLA